LQNSIFLFIISLEKAVKIAKVFGVTVDFLFGEGEYSSYDQKSKEFVDGTKKFLEQAEQHLKGDIKLKMQPGLTERPN
jgi:phage portal protein BeeE